MIYNIRYDIRFDILVLIGFILCMSLSCIVLYIEYMYINAYMLFETLIKNKIIWYTLPYVWYDMISNDMIYNIINDFIWYDNYYTI